MADLYRDRMVREEDMGLSNAAAKPAPQGTTVDVGMGIGSITTYENGDYSMGGQTQSQYGTPTQTPGQTPNSQWTNLPRVDPNDPDFASKMRANLARAEWDDYIARFQPIEDELIAELGKPADVDGARANVTASFDNARAGMQRQQEKYGINMDAQAKAATSRGLGLQQSLATAGAANQARRAKRARDLGIMGGGLSIKAGTGATGGGGE